MPAKRAFPYIADGAFTSGFSYVGAKEQPTTSNNAAIRLDRHAAYSSLTSLRFNRRADTAHLRMRAMLVRYMSRQLAQGHVENRRQHHQTEQRHTQHAKEDGNAHRMTHF